MEFTIEIPGKPPTLNQIRNKHWWVAHKAKQAFYRDALPLLKALPKPLPTPLQIEVEQYCTPIRDVDNCVVAIKFLLDLLQEHGYLPNDSPPYIPKASMVSKKSANKAGDKMVFTLTGVVE